MFDLKAFVDDIESRLTDIFRDGMVTSYPLEVSAITRALMALDVSAQSRRLESELSPERVVAFFNGCQPTTLPCTAHLFPILWRALSVSIEESSEGHLYLDRAVLLSTLSRLADAVRDGKVDYSLSLRLTNIAISEDFDLADGIAFHNLDADAVTRKYPIERRFAAVPEMVEEHWPKHRVEVILKKRGTPAEIQSLSHIKPLDALVHSLLNPFLFVGIAPSCPSITHIVIDSVLGGSCHHHGSGGSFVYDPHVLRPDEITRLKDMYSFLADEVPSDRILETAVDRFILGKKRNTHHPNRINEANWDKIVDYVIAMETLFLTVNGEALNDELSYRFSLNGSSLLERAIGGDVRPFFHALKSLYGLRSTVVHGGKESAILKNAKRFIEHLGADRPDHQHSLGRLLITCRLVEDWILRTLLYLRTVPSPDRPFRKKDGWEELLWQKHA